jgi:hypothetical protein
MALMRRLSIAIQPDARERRAFWLSAMIPAVAVFIHASRRALFCLVAE